MRRTTVIFDLDGTLLDTLGDLADSVNYIMKQYGYPPHTVDDVRQMVGNGVWVLLEKALPQGRENPRYSECVQDFQRYYSSHMQIKTGPFPGIMEMLDALAREGYHLAVVSNKFDLAVKALCRDYLGERIPVAIGESPHVARKPAPDTVFAAMKHFSVSSEECVYVGDSDVDIATAQNAGIPCISVNWGFRNTEFLQAHGASVIVESPEELLALLIDRHPRM